MGTGNPWCPFFCCQGDKTLIEVGKGQLISNKASLLMTLLTKSQESPRKLQKISGQNSLHYFVAILVQMMTLKRHFEINLPLVTSLWCTLW